ncbi:MAG: proton-conducting transporter membrane subunit, partial [Actinomycetes bacterium]
MAQQLDAPAIDYGAVAPVLVILGVACAGVLVEAFIPRRQRWSVQVTLTLLGLACAGVTLGLHLAGDRRDSVTLAGTVAVDGPALFLWGTLLALGLGAVLLIADRSVEPGGSFVADAAVRPGTAQDRIQASESDMQTEVFPLFLFSLGGMMVFTAANDLLTMFIALEVLSLPLYLMCGLARRRRLLSQEAAVKYFLLGAFSSAFFLYGVALLYGYAGSVTLSAIAEASVGTDRPDTLLLGGLALLVIGLLGFMMRRYGLPVVPAIIGVILSDGAERQLRTALRISNGDPAVLIDSPLAVGIYVLVVVVLIAPLLAKLL